MRGCGRACDRCRAWRGRWTGSGPPRRCAPRRERRRQPTASPQPPWTARCLRLRPAHSPLDSLVPAAPACPHRPQARERLYPIDFIRVSDPSGPRAPCTGEHVQRHLAGVMVSTDQVQKVPVGVGSRAQPGQAGSGNGCSSPGTMKTCRRSGSARPPTDGVRLPQSVKGAPGLKCQEGARSHTTMPDLPFFDAGESWLSGQGSY